METKTLDISQPMTVYQAVSAVIITTSKKLLKDEFENPVEIINALAKLVEARAKLNEY